MDIAEIKSRLSIKQVLEHYGLKADGNGKLCCPFHEDKTPSMQVYENTNTYTCFSSNCKAGSGDVIDFIQNQEKCNKHQALLKATELATGQLIQTKVNTAVETAVSETARIALLERAFTFYKNALLQAETAKTYLKDRKLTGNGAFLEIGFNAARFHFRAGLGVKQLAEWQAMGMIKPIEGEKTSYRSWAKDCLIFPLKNKEGQIVSFYGRSIYNQDQQRHYYMKDRSGLYPHYPQADAQTLILTESVIDAASLLSTGLIKQSTAVLACYGTNGLGQEHIKAMSQLKNLQEIIFFFDGDAAGIAAIEKHSTQLSEILNNITISKVSTPEAEDINSLHQGHEQGVFEHLLQQRVILKTSSNIVFSSSEKPESIKGEIDLKNPEHIVYQTAELEMHIWGGIELHNLGSLKVSLHIKLKSESRKQYRDSCNLYSFTGLKRATEHISQSLGISSTYVGEILADLTIKLENYRLIKKTETQKAKQERPSLNPLEYQEAINLLKSPELLRKTLKLLEESGLVGQQKNGMLLFLLYLSRLMEDPLHAILFGKSGSGKTYLQTKIADCIPPEDLRVVTSLTENTLYYSPKGFWKHKVLMIEDLEGVYQAFLPLRELMSKQEIAKFTTDKDSQGNNVQLMLKVEGPICVSGATTKEQIYEDNANRSYLLIIDESPQHLEQVMDYQRREYAGQIDKTTQEKAKIQLQNAQRILKKVKVINPYATQLILPELVFKKLRTNNHYLKLIQIISFWGQYNRPIKTNANGENYIETTIEDIQWANRLIKESLLIKSDELGSNVRQFLEILKAMLKDKTASERSFYAKEIRQKLRLNPMTVNRHLRELEMRGYIRQVAGNRKTGYEYQIEQWSEYQDLQQSIEKMDENLEKIKCNISITQV